MWREGGYMSGGGLPSPTRMSDTGTPLAETDDAEDDVPDPEDVDTSHLDDVEDGCGCAELWEHLSEERAD